MSDRQQVLIIGSGYSVGEIDNEEKNILKKIKNKISLNKTEAFSEVSGMECNELFFLDAHSNESLFFTRKIISNKKYLKRLVLNPFWKDKIEKNFWRYLRLSLIFYFKSVLRDFKRIDVKNIRKWLILTSLRSPILCNVGQTLIFCENTQWNMRNNQWAEDFSKLLYHYRGSFSSLLNYISIQYKNSDVYLAGVDFNKGEYFFNDQYQTITKYKFLREDWTSEIVKNNDKHFSFIEYNGSTMEDELTFMLKKTKEKNISIYSLNEKSLLVSLGYVSYKSIGDIK